MYASACEVIDMDRIVKTTTTYEVNGVKYASLDDIPQEHRAAIERMLEDQNNDGIPDIVQDNDGVKINAKVLTKKTTESTRHVRSDCQPTENAFVRQLDEPEEKPGITINISGGMLMLVVFILLVAGAAIATVLLIN